MKDRRSCDGNRRHHPINMEEKETQRFGNLKRLLSSTASEAFSHRIHGMPLCFVPSSASSSVTFLIFLYFCPFFTSNRSTSWNDACTLSSLDRLIPQSVFNQRQRITILQSCKNPEKILKKCCKNPVKILQKWSFLQKLSLWKVSFTVFHFPTSLEAHERSGFE